ncbi:hypothetical protein LSH36_246g03012 [Paralvinella palmiformis]|uniref:Uncharacterized protein n=1 Tax=Paralvinella palmiformis TaxID=53620 RepID=A0AAD9JNE8_9ANNE|nr:hypothetical protein LSH36_246g03012 [Paralvinella palmiformis]
MIGDSLQHQQKARPADLKVTHSRHVMPDLISTDDEWPGTMWMEEKKVGDDVSTTATTSVLDNNSSNNAAAVTSPLSKLHDGIFVDSILGSTTIVTSVVTSPACSVTAPGVCDGRQNTFSRLHDLTVHVTQSTSLIQAQVAYAPTPCGCFYNKHSLTHMLGLCRLPMFRKRCKHRGVTKHKDCVYALYTPKLQVRGHGSLRGVPSTREKMPTIVKGSTQQQTGSNIQQSDGKKRSLTNLVSSSKTCSGKKSAKSNLDAVTRQLSEIDYGFNPTFTSSSLPKEAFLSLRKEKHRRHCRAEGATGVDVGSGKSSGFWTMKFKSFSRGSKTKLTSSGRRQRLMAGNNRPGIDK